MLFAPIFGNIWPDYLGHAGQYGVSGPGFSEFISNIIDVAIIVSGLAFFAFLVLGGLRYITASGDVKQTQEATKQITSAIMGLVIVVGAFAITRIIERVLGISIFAPIFKGP